MAMWVFRFANNTCLPYMFYTKIRLIICCFLSLFIALLDSCRQAPTQINFLTGDLSDAFSTAKRLNKKVFVLISDSTCGNCISLLKELNRQKKTIETLTDDYVCYKADIHDTHAHIIAEIVKCPSYPFPYVFDSDGTLLAFGFPKSREFNLNDLGNINISNERFTELFKLPINTEQYKEMVSASLKATLTLGQDNQAAFKLLTNSLAICAYPYNLRNLNLLRRPFAMTDKILEMISVSAQNSSDRFLYGDIKKYIGVQAIPPSSEDNRADYQVSKNTEAILIKSGSSYPFSFKIENTADKPLIIYKVSHPCSCIKLVWSVKPIKADETVVIKGVFTPSTVGGFSKEIFIHTNSLKKPMDIYKISGTVYNNDHVLN
jgi:hypothetical protein